MVKIGFIGAGQMARALGGGIAQADCSSSDKSSVPSYSFFVSDPSTAAIESFCEAVGTNATVTTLATNAGVIAKSEIVFLAVKPQYFDAAINPNELRDVIASPTDSGKLIVSIVAGIPISRIVSQTGIASVVRTMPNTPCLIGAGAIGLSCSDSVTSDQRLMAIDLLSTTGSVVLVEEESLDVVTGLSGSGPGYVFEFLESLTLGGVNNGLPRELAQTLAIETVLGAASLAKESGEEPIVLRDRVTSPGGTTLAGLNALEAGDFRNLVGKAVAAATARSKELRAGN